MKLEKLTEPNPAFEVDLAAFLPAEGKVQGAAIAKSGKNLLIHSPRRYKLFCDGVHYVKILEGSGHFKWARGERDFSAGEAFRLENAGEYELNGAGKYLVIR